MRSLMARFFFHMLTVYGPKPRQHNRELGANQENG